jgi:hypothetical protein
VVVCGVVTGGVHTVVVVVAGTEVPGCPPWIVVVLWGTVVVA